MVLANEYEKLLRYLDKHEPKKTAIPTLKENKSKPQTKKEIASQNTKKLLEEAISLVDSTHK